MDRLQRASVMLSLLEALRGKGSWCGETHIQKAMYCLQEITAVPTDFDFILYKHGPFSFNLRDELTAMRADGLVEMHLNPSPFGPSLYPTDAGLALRNRFPKTVAMYQRQVDFIAAIVGTQNVAALERLATALYVTREMPGGTVEERAGLLNQLKPHISIGQAIEAVKEVDRVLGGINNNVEQERITNAAA
jgi:hypothetical protein